MSEEVTIHIGVPTVRQTKLQPNGDIEVRAQTFSFSLHHQQRNHAPTVGERLLVAVLSGVHPEWLPGGKIITDDEDTQIPRIDCELVSGECFDNGTKIIARERDGPDDVDCLSFTNVDRGRTKRLHLAMTNQSRSKVYGIVVLNKGQVTQMLAALIAIYPQLHED